VPHVWSNIDHFVINLVVCGQADVEVFTFVVSPDVDAGLFATVEVVDDWSELYARSDLFEFFRQQYRVHFSPPFFQPQKSTRSTARERCCLCLFAALVFSG
jgi:hypothetical protein